MKTVYDLDRFWTSMSAIFGFTFHIGRMTEVLTPDIYIELTAVWWSHQYGRHWLHLCIADALSSPSFQISGLIRLSNNFFTMLTYFAFRGMQCLRSLWYYFVPRGDRGFGGAVVSALAFHL